VRRKKPGRFVRNDGLGASREREIDRSQKARGDGAAVVRGREERFLSAQADPSQEAKGKKKVGLLRSE